MKIYFVLFFSILTLCVNANSKVIICGKIKSNEEFFINFYEPINGYYNIAFYDTAKQNSSLINRTDSFFKVLNIEKPCFIKIYFTDSKNQFVTLSDVLIFPGDSLNIHFDLSADSPNSIQYAGSNALGNKLFNEINFQPYNKYIPVFDALDRLPYNKATIVKEVDSIANSLIYRFDTLSEKHIITQDFVQYLSICIRSLFYNEVINKFLRPGKKRDVITKAERDSIIVSFFKLQNPRDERIKALYLSNFYINNYYNYLSYVKFNLISIQPLIQGEKIYEKQGRKFSVKEDFVPFIYIPDENVRKDLWALEIIGFYSWNPGKYDESVIKQFDSVFPNNNWHRALYNQYQNKYVSKKIGYSLNSPIFFIDTLKTINNLSSLIAQLPLEKPVFIDIWASWCGPCIAEFGYNKQLDSFLLSKKITKVYLSFDGAEANDKWRKAIQKYSLGGYHINANDSLKNEIREKIYKTKVNEGMGIPRYILINEKGVIMIDDTAFPHDTELLTNQIFEALKIDNSKH